MSASFPAPVPRGRPSNVLASLERTRLGLGRLVAAAFAAVAPATVVFGGATGGWAVTGVVQMPLAYIAVAAVLAVFSVGYVAMSRQIVNAGAFYSYITAGLGRIPGVAAAMSALQAYTVMQIGLAGGFGYGMHQTLLAFGHDVPWWLLSGVACLVVAVLGLLRVGLSGTILAVLLAAELVIVLVFAAVHLAHPAGGTVTVDALSPLHLSLAGLAVAACVTIAGYVGFESAPAYSEEARDARRTVPRATIITLMVALVVYAIGSWAMAVAAGPDQVVGLAATHFSELPFVLAQPYLGEVWLDAGHVLFCTSLFAAMLSFHNTAARYTFALGRERVLPSWFERFNGAGAPVWGSLTQTVLATGSVVLFAVRGWDPFLVLFFAGTVLGGFGVLLLMTVTSVAVWRYFARLRPRRDNFGAWPTVIAPILSAALLAAVTVLSVWHFDLLVGVSATSAWRYTLPGSFGVAAVLGVARAVYLRTRRPSAYAGIGQGAPDLGDPVAAASPDWPDRPVGAAGRAERQGRGR
ncbi:APC family permease [Dactylosporangium sp. McL0621]|uniref:APC family permease n=1 Tax=Dactylosporangium sp. McL0621 TaxID=3415678 RepID=UPI003CEBBF2C